MIKTSNNLPHDLIDPVLNLCSVCVDVKLGCCAYKILYTYLLFLSQELCRWVGAAFPMVVKTGRCTSLMLPVLVTRVVSWGVAMMPPHPVTTREMLQ